MDGRQFESIPLEAHLEELRRRQEAVARLQGGATYAAEDLVIFRDYARRHDLLLRETPPELSQPPSDEGNEHQVWFRPERKSFLKATHPNFFGLKVLVRGNEDLRASVIDYLERWQLHNQFLADAAVFLGVIETDQGLRVLIEQPGNSWNPGDGGRDSTFLHRYRVARVIYRRRASIRRP